jgi:FhaA, N-terminal domain/FHA domain
MGLQQFERRLERMVEGVFARAFRGGLQPVEIGRRLTREMDLRRTVAPRGTLAPNQFVVLLSQSDRARFAPIEEELIDELVTVAKDHADIERYTFLGPVTVEIKTDEDLSPGMVLISSEIVRPDEPPKAYLVLPDGTKRELGTRPLTIGRLPDCQLVLADPNVSRYHAEVRPVTGSASGAANNDAARDYEVSDMGSTNGTKVNGIPLTAARALHEGDQITLGATTIRFERG